MKPCVECSAPILPGQPVVAYCRGTAPHLTITPRVYHAWCFDAKMESPPRMRIQPKHITEAT